MRPQIKDRETGFDENIPDLTSYNIEMRKSLLDKIFFMDKVDAEVFVDYGCADGATINFMRILFPEKIYIGYDISEANLNIARNTCPGVRFSSDWDEIRAWVAEYERKDVAVILNSLLHEVYSYGSPSDIQTFWENVFDSSMFGTVIIRDMCVSRTTSRMSDPMSVMKIRQRYDQAAINEFEQQWGSLNENWALVHFLLKYRYKVNWAREVRENYLPVNLEDLMAKIPSQWCPQFVEHFTLPFIRNQVKKDFNLELQDRTHIKMILHFEAE